MTEQYKLVLENINKFENKMAFAKKTGDRLKAKNFKQTLNELYVKRDDLEGKYPKEAFKELQDKLTEKSNVIESLKAQNTHLMEEIDKINQNLAKLNEPKKEEEEDDGKIECPNCNRRFKNLSAHQRSCKKGQQ